MKNTFTAETNPLNNNETIIFEHVETEKILRFHINKANFEDDADFNDFISFLLNNLN